MDTPENTTENTTPRHGRPLGSWLRLVDALLTDTFAREFADEEASRREWMLLSVIDGDLTDPDLRARMMRKPHRLRRLADRGWIERGDGDWTLTLEGRAAKERLGAIVDRIRARVAGAVTPEDYATTMASLEAIARELGWPEGQRPPRRGRRRGFGRDRGFGRGFEHGHGFPHGHGHGHGHDRGFEHGRPWHHGPHHHGHPHHHARPHHRGCQAEHHAGHEAADSADRRPE
ncbi:hypothetical protein [Microbacterium hominis]|uniref:MarR family transcriptional regulator n=1 Tax=Microbacterium hominis TaxID=162426 RepID=A0A7D4TIR0_9MICO|nr:hypothetical protein [Microbacterium hominis]QKJ20861.1 hypothetical protein HQM25_16835 [Microbacterium hominis]